MFTERIHIGNLKEADVRSFDVISHILGNFTYKHITYFKLISPLKTTQNLVDNINHSFFKKAKKTYHETIINNC